MSEDRSPNAIASKNVSAAIASAATVVRFASEIGLAWPEDEWFSLNEDWDLNLYVDAGIPMALIYPVEKGRTITDSAISVDTSSIHATLSHPISNRYLVSRIPDSAQFASLDEAMTEAERIAAASGSNTEIGIFAVLVTVSQPRLPLNYRHFRAPR